MNENSACPIWGTPAAVSLSHDANDIQCDEGSTEYQDVDSPRAGGRYRIRKDASVLLHEVSLKARLTSWLIDAWLACRPTAAVGREVPGNNGQND